MDINKSDYYNKKFIYFLQHPEKPNYYLIIQAVQSEFDDLYADFNRTGKYEDKPLNLLMPCNKVKLAEQIVVPDSSMFGLCYFITHEIPEISYEEDERYTYTEWGWYVISGKLDVSKWLQQYLQKQQEKKTIHSVKATPQQISLF